jgi:hemerythrin
MKWTKECRLGIDEIDFKHRLLFAISNERLNIEGGADEAPEFKYP